MGKNEIYYGWGMTQEEYKKSIAHLEKLEAIESDWKELLRWVISVSKDIEFYNEKDEKVKNTHNWWNNHVLTVLIEIVQKQPEAYKKSFIHERGTATQDLYVQNLREKIQNWITRLETFISTQWQNEQLSLNSSAIQAAEAIKIILETSLFLDTTKQNLPNKIFGSSAESYYKMLNAISEVKTQCSYFVDMIEKSGDMDPALALLLTFIRNYGNTVQRFNQTISTLPTYYQENILRAKAKRAVQDETYVIVNPSSPDGFTLPAKTGFKAGTKEDGDELIYRNQSPEFITAAKLDEVYATFSEKDESSKTKRYKQIIDFANPETYTHIFSKDKSCTNYVCGWFIESQTLVLEEGKRTVKLHFQLTGDSNIQLKESEFSDVNLTDFFVIEISNAEGWNKLEVIAKYEEHTEFTFEFTLQENDLPPVCCSTSIHHTETKYPAIRILMNTNENCPYDWASFIEFESIQIDTNVEGIRNFTLYNELGEIDSTLPFYPFGTQAEKGSWFMFGNEEMSMKKLSEISLKGVWGKLPQTAKGYEDIYKDYQCTPPIVNESFKIKTEWQEGGKWHPCLNSPAKLFTVDKDKKLLNEDAVMSFTFPETVKSTKDQSDFLYRRDRNCFFRTTLVEPSIGFGWDAYRQLFAKVMIENSRPDVVKPVNIPNSPIIPFLSDAALSYKAKLKVKLQDLNSENTNQSIRLSKITILSEYDGYPITEPCSSLPLIPKMEEEPVIYLGYKNAVGNKKIKIYIDLYLGNENVFSEYGTDYCPIVKWNYLLNDAWSTLPSDLILMEGTSGFTQNGSIEIELPQTIDRQLLDHNSTFWLRMHFDKILRAYPAVRGVYANCIKVTAENGNGSPLPQGTIKSTETEDVRIDSIIQPMAGMGGKLAETQSSLSVEQSTRIFNRNRVLTPKDYERMILGRFSYIEKVHCLTQTQTNSKEIRIVVFSHEAKDTYPFTPAWKLATIKDFLSNYISPFVTLKICNPSYEKLTVECKATVKSTINDQNEMLRKLDQLIRNYFASWLQKGILPELGQSYSYKALHALIANEKDIQKIHKLVVNGVSLDDVDVSAEDIYIHGNPLWNILIPDDIIIELKSSGTKVTRKKA